MIMVIERNDKRHIIYQSGVEGNLEINYNLILIVYSLYMLLAILVLLQRDSICPGGRVANCRSNGGLALTVPGGTRWIKLLVPATQYSNE